MDHIEKLHTQAAEVDKEIRTVQAAVEADGRTMTTEEIARVSELNARFNALTAEIDLRKQSEARAAHLAAPAPRITQPEPMVSQAPATPRAPVTGSVVAHNFRNHGFEKGVGEYLVAVMNAKTSSRPDPRLMLNAVSTFGNEGVGADGAYALPPQFAASMTDAIIPTESFLSAMQPVQTNSNLLVVPVNQNAYWQNSTGITGATTAEGAAITASKPALSEVRVPLYKFASLVHVSEETLSDIPFMASWVMKEMANHLRYLLEDAVLNGTGEGSMLGILNAACTIAISDADSTASTIGAIDILKMESSLLQGSGSAFWVSNPTVFPAIAAMKTGTAGQALFQPDMTMPSRQALLGRPYYKSEANPILDTTGDIALIQPSGYILALKSGGVQTATTIGFAFDQELQSFRASLRAGGAPVLSAKVARAKSTGSTYASNFVVITGSRS